MSLPELGETVHYRSSWGECQAALVKGVRERGREQLTIEVFPPGFRSFESRPLHDETQHHGTWHWPCAGRQ